MSKREKIIIAVALGFIVYGIYSLFFGTKQKLSMPQKGNDIKSLISGIKEGIEKKKIRDREIYIIEVSRLDFPKDPFEIPKVKVEKKREEGKIQEVIKLHYFGFLEYNGEKIAIIDGLDYKEGERLKDMQEYVVKSIDPNKVVIQNIITQKTFEFPYKEQSSYVKEGAKLSKPSKKDIEIEEIDLDKEILKRINLK